ncbi:hypothetical protein OBBRIDRAFT_102003 [Obba rivulosa]|uniref:Uncharacterized protein n=1 Tax=Obba rivulosa TaxID=1052685 RepID=A0A8E2DRT2_9APHY|nr:hypothetical protein OBBRIDRAFT_102003 [Obba rivulosa]
MIDRRYLPASSGRRSEYITIRCAYLIPLVQHPLEKHIPSFIMLVSQCTRRALLAAPFSALQPLQRRMSATTPVLCLPAPDASPTFVDFNILDIFDAPSRLGESSKLLVMSAQASRARASRPVRSISTASVRKRPTIKPLPPPVLFDGPSRPRYMMSTPHRSYTAGSSVALAITPPSALPAPQVFDGPSKLRPYTYRGVRCGAGSITTVLGVPYLGTIWCCISLRMEQ